MGRAGMNIYLVLPSGDGGGCLDLLNTAAEFVGTGEEEEVDLLVDAVSIVVIQDADKNFCTSIFLGCAWFLGKWLDQNQPLCPKN